MKKTVRVTIEREFVIDIPDHLLTPENIAEFEGSMWHLESEDKREELFEYVARCAAYEHPYAEGMGYFGTERMKARADNPKDFIVVDELYDFAEMEITE